jgi:hypothetical protein
MCALVETRPPNNKDFPMGASRKQAVELAPSIPTAIDKKPAASVAVTPSNAASLPKSPISINNDPQRRGQIPLEWLDLEALTQYVSVSRRTLTEWLYQEENPLPASRIDGKLFVRRSDFDRWMEAHPVEASVNLGRIVDEVMTDLQERERWASIFEKMGASGTSSSTITGSAKQSASAANRPPRR